jgi:hypothetical protein
MEENKEQVVEETTQENVTKVEVKNTQEEDNVIKVNLDKPVNQEENEAKEDNADDSGVAAESENAEPTQEQKEVQPEAETQETPVLEEITEESTEEEISETEEKVEEAVAEAEATGKPLPENIQKLVDFMEETGGDINDYVNLNKDYTKLEDTEVLLEYYKQTKPHLSLEEISFLMQDSFSYNEDEDDETDIKRKKLALKEQVASARAHLDGQKSKYYEEIKAGSKLTKEQQKAVDFFNRYNKESEATKKTVDANSKIFEQKTNNLFNNKFKGFEYNIGDRKFRFNVKDVEGVKKIQSDSNNFMAKFVDKNFALTDAKGYHKSLFTAMNADAVANHFYEQGKADALKQSIAKSKNINMNPRQSQNTIEAGGIKVKVLGDNSSDFKFKIKNNK